MITIRERLFDIAIEIEELNNKEHLTIEDMNRMNKLVQESSTLQKRLIDNQTKAIKLIYKV